MEMEYPKSQNLAKFFRTIYSGPGELLGKSLPVKSKTFPIIYYDGSILCSKLKSLAFIVKEFILGQGRPPKSH